MAKLFKGNTDDLEEGINQILSLVKNPVSHLAKTFLTFSLEDLPTQLNLVQGHPSENLSLHQENPLYH